MGWSYAERMAASEMSRHVIALVLLLLPMPFAALANAGEKKSIRICTHPAEGFFLRAADGSASGLEFDLLNDFAAFAKLDASFTDSPSFDQLLKDTSLGRCDIGASTITVTEEREMRVRFSVPYFPNRIVVVQSGNSGFTTDEDLKGRRVAVVTGTISSGLVGSLPGVVPVDVKNDAAAFDALLKGDVAALACDSAVVLSYLARHPNLSIAFGLGGRDFFAFALPKDSNLVGPLNDYLRRLINSADFSRILSKHFGESNAELVAADVAEALAK